MSQWFEEIIQTWRAKFEKAKGEAENRQVIIDGHSGVPALEKPQNDNQSEEPQTNILGK